MRCLFGILLAVSLPIQNCISLLNPFTPDGTVCTDLFAYGVSVHVTEAATGQPINNAVLTLREGTYVETMQLIPTGNYVGAGERPGTYSLTIDVPDVASTTVDNVVVTADECHVRGVALEARVQPGQITVKPRTNVGQ